MISANGRYALFRSKAGNLTSTPFSNGLEKLFLRDLQTGMTYALTYNSGIPLASITPDGHFIAFYGI